MDKWEIVLLLWGTTGRCPEGGSWEAGLPTGFVLNNTHTMFYNAHCTLHIIPRLKTISKVELGAHKIVINGVFFNP